MKTLLKFTFLTSLLLSIISCSKEDDDINVQPHDENKMMKELHAMIDTMEATPMPGDPDHHFAKMMQLHHKGAINMANIILQDGKDTAIRRMAQMVVEKQTQEIADLQAFLDSHTLHVENPEFNMKIEMSMEKMDRNADLQIINGNLDHDFAILLIFHHQSAIEMADLVIHYGHEATIREMAEMMKDDQEMEIVDLQKWLLRDGN
jgi:uncharacterized protein (DUF305 family)